MGSKDRNQFLHFVISSRMGQMLYELLDVVIVIVRRVNLVDFLLGEG